VGLAALVIVPSPEGCSRVRGADDNRENPFAARLDPKTRARLVEKHGGTKDSEEAVARGLEWLALHQAQDGRWSIHEFNQHARTKPFPDGRVFKDDCEGLSNRKNDIAATGLALLPFLAAGQTKSPSKGPDYSKGVKGGLQFLIRKQDRTTGFYGIDMYAHGIATIAMCEAYGMTGDASYKASAQNALNYIERSQHTAGGWRYTPNTAGDLSVTGWQLIALKTGRLVGLNVKDTTIKKAKQFLMSCEAQWTGEDGRTRTGGYSYQPGSGETSTMTAVGMLCSIYLDTSPRSCPLLHGADRLRRCPPGTTKNLYYDWHATEVLFHMGDEDHWKFWNEGPEGKNGIRDVLIKKQDDGRVNESHRGSWEQEGAGHANDGGRIMATSLSLLCLEVYYRHPRLFKKE
jgi:hypothetical protein